MTKPQHTLVFVAVGALLIICCVYLTRKKAKPVDFEAVEISADAGVEIDAGSVAFDAGSVVPTKKKP